MGDEIGRNISFKRSECSIHYLTLTQNRNEENEYSTVVHHVQMQSKWAEHTHIDVDIATVTTYKPFFLLRSLKSL